MGKYAGEDDLIFNTSTRLPVCLVVDTSSSMLRILDDLTGVEPARQEFRDGQMWNIFEGDFNTYLKQINAGVNKFYNAIRDNEVAASSAEIAIVTFDDSIKVREDFQTVDAKGEFHVDDSETGDNTNLGAGVKQALEMLEARKQQYKSNGVDYFQPWIVILTDGDPTDTAAVQEAQRKCVEMENNNKLTVFVLTLGEDLNKDTLKGFSNKRRPMSIIDDKVEEFFEWLGKSVSVVAQTNPGDKVKLDSDIDDWLNTDI